VPKTVRSPSGIQILGTRIKQGETVIITISYLLYITKYSQIRKPGKCLNQICTKACQSLLIGTRKKRFCCKYNNLQGIALRYLQRWGGIHYWSHSLQQFFLLLLESAAVNGIQLFI